MLYVQHRVNDIEKLPMLPTGIGAEIDLRSDIHQRGAIHLQHDPWALINTDMTVGTSLEQYLDMWRQEKRGPLILNTKEDALEETALEALSQRGIQNFFFLDTTLPTMVRLSRQGLGDHLTLRLSAMEPASSLTPWLALRSPFRPKYLWVDCFGQVPLDVHVLKPLVAHFVPILVSPDLQGDLSLLHLDRFKALARLCKIICTKQPAKWSKAFQVPTATTDKISIAKL